MPGSASSTGARAASRSIRCTRSSKTRRRERRRVARGAAHHHVRRRCVRSALPPKHTPKGGRVGQGSVYEMGRLCPPVRQGIGENQGPRLGTVFFYLLSINFIVFCQHPLRWPPFLRMRLSKGDRRARAAAFLRASAASRLAAMRARWSGESWGGSALLGGSSLTGHGDASTFAGAGAVSAVAGPGAAGSKGAATSRFTAAPPPAAAVAAPVWAAAVALGPAAAAADGISTPPATLVAAGAAAA